jgi:hypothetical protein
MQYTLTFKNRVVLKLKQVRKMSEAVCYHECAKNPAEAMN